MYVGKALTFIIASSIVMSAITNIKHKQTNSLVSCQHVSEPFSKISKRQVQETQVDNYQHMDDDDSAQLTGIYPDEDVFLQHIRDKYSKYMLLRFHVTSQKDRDHIFKVADDLLLDIWSVSNGYIDLTTLASNIKTLMGLLPEEVIARYLMVSSDLSQLIFNTYPKAYRKYFSTHTNIENITSSYLDTLDIHSSSDLFFQDYQPLPVIYRWMQLLQVMFPSLIASVTVGTSHEGREIKGLWVGARQNDLPKTTKKILLITGGLHAREWVSTSSVSYLIWSFVTRNNKDHVITKILETFDIIFIPVMNPDGYEYTWSTDRLWRKSRQPTPSLSCTGVDLDHAFGFQWDGSSSSHKNPCSESFAGQKPFEATEALQISEWARNITKHKKTEFIGLIDLHSYSQQVLIPYSYSCRVDPPNLENLQELAAGLTKAIRLANGEQYNIASACDGVAAMHRPFSETGGGSAIDWFYHEMKAHYSYQIKLQDTGIYGFLLPKEYIIPSGEEILSAMRYLGDFLLGNNGIEYFSKKQEDRIGNTRPNDTNNGELRR